LNGREYIRLAVNIENMIMNSASILKLFNSDILTFSPSTL